MEKILEYSEPTFNYHKTRGICHFSCLSAPVYFFKKKGRLSGRLFVYLRKYNFPVLYLDIQTPAPCSDRRFRFSSLYVWRDCVGIEPTGPGTQAPQGFEDPGRHQSPIQPQNIQACISLYRKKGKRKKGAL
jgi:hypothetical protein